MRVRVWGKADEYPYKCTTLSLSGVLSQKSVHTGRMLAPARSGSAASHSWAAAWDAAQLASSCCCRARRVRGGGLGAPHAIESESLVAAPSGGRLAHAMAVG